MTKKERIERMEKDLATLKAEVVQEEKNERWKPRIGEGYWCITGNGVIFNYTWRNLRMNTNHFSFFNCFKTQQEAKKARKLVVRSNAIITACLMTDPDFEPDWENINKEKWYVYFNQCSNKWVINYNWAMKYSVAYISTKEKAQQVCKLLTEWGI